MLQAHLHGPDTSGEIAISERKQGYWQGGNPAVTEHVNRVAQSANAILSASASGNPIDGRRRGIQEGTAHQRCLQVELIENPLRHRTFAHVGELVERSARPHMIAASARPEGRIEAIWNGRAAGVNSEAAIFAEEQLQFFIGNRVPVG